MPVKMRMFSALCLLVAMSTWLGIGCKPTSVPSHTPASVPTSTSLESVPTNTSSPMPSDTRVAMQTATPSPVPTRTSSSMPSHTPAPTPTGTPTPSVSSLVIYADTLAAGWEDWSWDCERDLKVTSPAHEGRYAIAIDYAASGWGGFALGQHTPFSVDDYTYLEFWIHGGTDGGQRLRVSVHTCQDGCEQPAGGLSVKEARYMEDGLVSPNAWKRVSVPLADLGAEKAVIFKFSLMGNSGDAQPTFYVDDIALVKKPVLPAATTAPTPVVENKLPPIVAGEYVTRQGNQLVLGGQPFRFVGTNAYFLQPEMAHGNAAGVVETLDTAVSLGMYVVRMWAFNDHDPHQDPAAIQVEPGVYREESLVALDKVIAEARQRNVRLILTLTNNWKDYGGIERYLGWCNCGASRSDFYTNEQIKGWYRDYVHMLINRINTVTGTAYKDEPAILAWELGNELRNPGGQADNLLAWQEEMAAYIKSLDPNHLVADGGEGFDDAPELYHGLSNLYPVRGDEGASYHRLTSLPSVDMVSYHLYPGHWGLTDDSDVEIWIRVHEELARQAGKVAYLGEYGVMGDDAGRAVTFDRWLTTALIDNQSAGALVWGLTYNSRPDYDQFSVYCPQHSETCVVLSEYAVELATDSGY